MVKRACCAWRNLWTIDSLFVSVDASMKDGAAAFGPGDAPETSEDREELLRGLMGADDNAKANATSSDGVATMSDLAALDADRPKMKFEVSCKSNN